MKIHVDAKRVEQLNVVRHKEMSENASKLLALANQLKTEMDESSRQTQPSNSMYIQSLRQAEQIEKLAHNVRDTMRSTVTEDTRICCKQP